MKKIILLLFVSLIVFSCKTPKKKKPTPTVVTKEYTPRVVTKEVIVDKKIEKIDNTLIKLEKKPCSGDCPVFEVVVKQDSTLVFKGKNYTSVEGIHIIKLNAQQYSEIIEAIRDSNFKSLKNKYFDETSRDFSETVITYSDKNVSIKLWKDAPEKLTKIYVLLEDILYDKKFLE